MINIRNIKTFDIKNVTPEYFRNFIFGAEDSLVSTVGVLFGIASASGYNKDQILLTGLVLVAVEALSMGVGIFLTETETHEVDVKHTHRDSPLFGAIIMFFSYVVFGLVALSPFIFLEPSLGRFISLGFTIIALFSLGYLPTKSYKAAVRMVVIAGIAVSIGFLIASILSV
jgi:VIT1/CCC1 family predicted Fe2+/Mn2+ transporter